MSVEDMGCGSRFLQDLAMGGCDLSLNCFCNRFNRVARRVNRLCIPVELVPSGADFWLRDDTSLIRGVLAFSDTGDTEPNSPSSSES